MDRDSITRVANLAGLDLSDEEIRLLSTQLGRVLDHFNAISALDPDDVDPEIHGQDAGGPVREDRPGMSLPRDELMANTEHEKDGFFSVTRVINPLP